jgi:hypothetical protein
MRCLSKSPEERYARASELADALFGFLGDRATPELRLAWRTRRITGSVRV